MRRPVGIMSEHRERFGALNCGSWDISTALEFGLQVTTGHGSHSWQALRRGRHQQLPHILSNIADFLPRVRANIQTLSAAEPRDIPS
jgi:hypothetical protein